jgi:hypothetical protein
MLYLNDSILKATKLLAQIRGLRMVTVASDFLSMLNGKWSSEKLQDEQFKDKLE